MGIRTFAALCTAAALTFGGAASAASPYTNIYAFGDSLSDSGNIYAISGGVLPTAPYFTGRFSNGPTWVENLAQAMSLNIGPAVFPFGAQNNYAFGGAKAGGGTPIDLGAQVLSYLAKPGSADPNALYVIWAGGNDLRGATDFASASAAISVALTGISNAMGALYLDGARHFLVGNMPNLGLTPEAQAGGPGTVGLATTASVLYNTYFNGAMASLDALPGNDVRILDAFGLMNAIVSNPDPWGSFALLNVTTSCLQGSVVCANPHEYLFWDSIHPADRGHELIAEYALTVVGVPEPETYAMFLAGLGLLGAVARRRAMR